MLKLINDFTQSRVFLYHTQPVNFIESKISEAEKVVILQRIVRISSQKLCYILILESMWGRFLP